MLSLKTIQSRVAAIVTTLYELDAEPAESTLYLALGMDLPLWESLRGLLVASDLIVIRSHLVSLTAKGRDLGREYNAILAKTKAGADKSTANAG